MKKEVFLAVFVGLAMGLIITFGVYRVRTSITNPPITEITKPNVTVDDPTQATILSLHSPEDGLIQKEKEITVTGSTIPNSHIVLFVNDSDSISTTDDSGNFSFNANLRDGSNVLRITVIDSSGKSTTEERLVVVSDILDENGNLAETTTASASATATASAKINN